MIHSSRDNCPPLGSDGRRASGLIFADEVWWCLARNMDFSLIIFDFLASYGWRTLFFILAAHRFLARVGAELRRRDRVRLAQAAVDPARVRALDSKRNSALNTLVERHQSVIAVEQVRLASESRARRDRAALLDMDGGRRLGTRSEGNQQ